MAGKTKNRLTLVVGPPNSGKLGRVFDWWRERQAARPLIVAPTAPDARDLTAEMVQRVGDLWGQSPVLTFDGLLGELCGRRPRLPSSFASSLLIERLLATLPLRCASLRTRAPGLVDAVRVFLDRLLESGRTVEGLVTVLERWKAEDRSVASLSDDLKQLLVEYSCLRDSLRFEDHGRVAQQAALALGSALGRWERPVAFYGFTSFTLWQRRLVEALAQKTEVLLTLSYDPARTVNLVSDDEYSRWRTVAADIREVGSQTPAYSSPAIAHLEAAFLAEDGSRLVPPRSDRMEGVRFLLASGRRGEAELAALEVARLLRQGLPPNQIAVVVRRLEPWRRILADVFGSCGIPFRLDQRWLLRETGLGHAFLTGLRGLLTNDAEQILRFLRSPYSGLEPEEAAEIERRFRRGTDKRAEVVLGLVESARPEVLGPLRCCLRNQPNGATVDAREAVGAVHCLLRAGLRSTTLGGEEAAEDVRAYRALVSALQSAAGLRDSLAGLGVNRCWPETGATIDLLGLDLLGRVPLPGDQAAISDGVQVLSVHRARTRRFTAMVVLGLVEGEFPGKGGSPSLLSENQRRRLDTLGEGLVPDDREEEAALFLSVVSRAWQLLLLSARDAEENGQGSVPSYFWTRSKELLGVEEKDILRRDLSAQLFPLSEAPSLCHYRRACAAGRIAPVPGLEATLARRAPRVVGPPGRLVMPLVLAELASITSFSPSALESYATCPSKWFFERVVGVDELEVKVDARVLGQLVHQVLAETYRRLGEAGLLPLRETDYALATKTAAAVVGEAMGNGALELDAAERRLVESRLRSAVQTVLRAEVEAGSSLAPEGLEVEVGGTEGVDIGGLRICGRVDRIDRMVQGEGLFVWDYKSGGIPENSKLGTADGLQVPIYLLALAVERPDQPVVGGAYLSTKEGTRSGLCRVELADLLAAGAKGLKSVDDMAWTAVLDKARETALAAAEGIRSGVIAPQRERDCPSWCRLGPVCRARRGSRR